MAQLNNRPADRKNWPGEDIFDILILVARPAAGKSEIIQFLKSTPAAIRKSSFRIGRLDEIDDFPMLWAWFEEDDLLAEMSKPRLHTTDDGYFRWQYLWDLLIRRVDLEYHKRCRDYQESSEQATVILEFARGKEHGGFRQAFQNLSDDVLSRAAVVYIDVSFLESLRKNRRRFNPNRPDSVLEHGLPDQKLIHLYGEVDWQDLTGGERSGYLNIRGIQVPYAVFENDDDVTTQGGDALASRLNATMEILWRLYEDLHDQ